MAPLSLDTRGLRRSAGHLARRVISSVAPAVRAQIVLARLRARLQTRVLPLSGHVHENLRSALGGSRDDHEIAEIGRRYVEYSKRLYLMNVLPRMEDFDDPEHWPVQGREHLDQALAGNRGVILLTAHFGYARLISPILRVHGYPVWLVVHAEPGDGSAVPSVGAWEIPAGLDVRPILGALSRNEVVVSAGDGLVAAEFVELSLLDKPYPFPTGIMKIAMMTSARVLPVFAIDGDDEGSIRVVLHPPLPISSSASVAENVGHFAAVLDRQLRSVPHLYNRWDKKSWFETVPERRVRRQKRYLGM